MPTPAASGETSLDGSVAARSGPSPSSTESYLRGATVNDKVPGEDPSATTPPPDIFFYGLRSRVDEFPNGHTDPDGRRRRGLVALRSGLRGRHPPSDDPGQRASQRMRRPRRLVYYSQTNPVVVTDIEDVVDSIIASPPHIDDSWSYSYSSFPFPFPIPFLSPRSSRLHPSSPIAWLSRGKTRPEARPPRTDSGWPPMLPPYSIEGGQGFGGDEDGGGKDEGKRMRSALRGEGVCDRGDLAWGGAETIVSSSLGWGK